MLKKIRRQPPAVPEVIEPPRLVKGKRDAHFPECVLVPLTSAPKHPMFLPLNPKYSFPKSTYYRYDKHKGEVRSLVTVMRDGTQVGWDTCGYCYAYFKYCRCKLGISVCRSVEYIHDAIEAQAKGEEWGFNHPNYRGSLTREERQKRAEDPYGTVTPARALVDSPPGVRPPAARTAPAGGKPLKRIRTVKERAAEEGLTEHGLDLGKVNDAAEEMAAKLTKRVLRKLPAQPAAPGGEVKPVRKLKKIRRD